MKEGVFKYGVRQYECKKEAEYPPFTLWTDLGLHNNLFVEMTKI